MLVSPLSLHDLVVPVELPLIVEEVRKVVVPCPLDFPSETRETLQESLEHFLLVLFQSSLLSSL